MADKSLKYINSRLRSKSGISTPSPADLDDDFRDLQSLISNMRTVRGLGAVEHSRSYSSYWTATDEMSTCTCYSRTATGCDCVSRISCYCNVRTTTCYCNARDSCSCVSRGVCVCLHRGQYPGCTDNSCTDHCHCNVRTTSCDCNVRGTCNCVSRGSCNCNTRTACSCNGRTTTPQNVFG